MAQNEAGLAERVRRLEAMVSQQADLISILEDENHQLACRVNSMEAHRHRSPVVGLHKGIVQGIGGDGEPAALDNAGNVKVHVPGVDEDGGATLTEVAVPWLSQGGGLQYLPRKGQSVYLGYLGGNPNHPVILGYDTNQDNILPKPGYSSDGKVKNQVPLSWEGEDQELFQEKVKNLLGSVIGSASIGDESKQSQIVFNDHPGRESLSVGTQGNLHLRAQGNHTTVADGVSKLRFNSGQDSEYKGYNWVKVRNQSDSYVHIETDEEKKAYEDKEGGNYALTVEGDETHIVDGDWKTIVSGKYLFHKPEYMMTKMDKLIENTFLEMEISKHWGMKGSFFADAVATVSAGFNVKAYLDLMFSLKLTGYLNFTLGLGADIKVGAFKTYWIGINSSKNLLEKKTAMAKLKEEVASLGTEQAKLGQNLVSLKETLGNFREGAMEKINDLMSFHVPEPPNIEEFGGLTAEELEEADLLQEAFEAEEELGEMAGFFGS